MIKNYPRGKTPRLTAWRCACAGVASNVPENCYCLQNYLFLCFFRFWSDYCNARAIPNCTVYVFWNSFFWFVILCLFLLYLLSDTIYIIIYTSCLFLQVLLQFIFQISCRFIRVKYFEPISGQLMNYNTWFLRLWIEIFDRWRGWTEIKHRHCNVEVLR